MNPTTPPAIRGETIRARRNQLGLTIKTACTTARMSTATWVTAEKGDPVTTRTATRIEQTLGWPQGTIHELDNAAADPTQLPGYQPPADTIARQLDRIEQLLRDTIAPTPTSKHSSTPTGSHSDSPAPSPESHTYSTPNQRSPNQKPTK